MKECAQYGLLYGGTSDRRRERYNIDYGWFQSSTPNAGHRQAGRTFLCSLQL